MDVDSVQVEKEKLSEEERLKMLRSFEILDTEPELAFDRITALAVRLFECEIAIMSLVDEERVWYKSTQGIDTEEEVREGSFCEHVIEPGPIDEMTGDVFIVLNARAHESFQNHPLVCGEEGVRFYAGAPLVTEEGLRLGALAIMSSKPRLMKGFSAREQVDLTDLAAQAMAELLRRRLGRERTSLEAKLAALEQETGRRPKPFFEWTSKRNFLGAWLEDKAREDNDQRKSIPFCSADLSEIMVCKNQGLSSVLCVPWAGGGLGDGGADGDDLGDIGSDGEGEGGEGAARPNLGARIASFWVNKGSPRGSARSLGRASGSGGTASGSGGGSDAPTSTVDPAPEETPEGRRGMMKRQQPARRTSQVDRLVAQEEAERQRQERRLVLGSVRAQSLKNLNVDDEEEEKVGLRGSRKHLLSGKKKDFDLEGQEAFLEKLKNGEYVAMKHGRMGKPKQRELKITEDLKTLTWLPQKLMPTAYDDPRFSGLVDRVREVRLAREIDRECPQYLGTAVLRRSLKPAHADRALSIIWRHRTLDLEFEDAAVCQEVVTGLRELVAEVRDEAEA